MDYAVSHSENSRTDVDPSLATSTVTVSAGFGVTTNSSSLSSLVTPSLSSISYCSGGGVSPMARFDFQVCHQWISKFDVDGSEAFVETFQSMRSTGTAYLTGYSSDTLRDMWSQGMIRWGEAEIQEQKIRSMKLPFDPGYDLSSPLSGPIIFVRQPEDGGKISIMNGNHRTAKILLEGGATSETLYVLELSSPEASLELFGVAPIARYANPRMPVIHDIT